MAPQVGLESACKRKFNNIESSGRHLVQCFPLGSVVTAGEWQVLLRRTSFWNGMQNRDTGTVI